MSYTYALPAPILASTHDYNKLKKTLKKSTCGYGSALSASYFITQGADQGVSVAFGALASYAYVSLLSERVDNFQFFKRSSSHLSVLQHLKYLGTMPPLLLILIMVVLLLVFSRISLHLQLFYLNV
jgi:hypothetical protein